MGWREALRRLLEMAHHNPTPFEANTFMAFVADWPAPDRIALARELLEGTGRVVARDVAAIEGVGELMVADNDRMRHAMVAARAAGWNACRAAMLGDDE